MKVGYPCISTYQYYPDIKESIMIQHSIKKRKPIYISEIPIIFHKILPTHTLLIS